MQISFKLYWVKKIFKYHKSLYDINFRNLSPRTRCIGSAALTLCYVASGIFDCYHVEDLKAWDIAGGAVILREAGGVIYHTKGMNWLAIIWQKKIMSQKNYRWWTWYYETGFGVCFDQWVGQGCHGFDWGGQSNYRVYF